MHTLSVIFYACLIKGVIVIVWDRFKEKRHAA
jgi:hypothetical protein